MPRHSPKWHHDPARSCIVIKRGLSLFFNHIPKTSPHRPRNKSQARAAALKPYYMHLSWPYGMTVVVLPWKFCRIIHRHARMLFSTLAICHCTHTYAQAFKNVPATSLQRHCFDTPGGSFPAGSPRHPSPSSPQLNGKVERSHRSDQEEFYQLLTYKGDVDLQAKLEEWERFYNFGRPHGAFNGQTPYEALRERL